ncbi:sensor histidine kinase [Larkinella punicea]|uniref:Histidine kinase n=1 Tax=Larkinella punicea TaxID=2315727 RepID=A0A368JQ89_9BACT|nr:sensor histidine kinase [Larkinella punicea]RCR69156.1 histidine kinase [Larkinella punicea]
MTRLWCIALLLICSLSVWSHAQTARQFRFEHLGINQGLANNVVYALLQDREGYMWFATDNGLSKYDGYTVTTYKKIPGDTTSLAGNSVIQLMEDRDGFLWLGMMGQGICKFDKQTETFTCYGPTPQTLHHGTINTLVEDREGDLWVANGTPELRKFDKKTGTYSRFNYATLLAEKSSAGKIPEVNTIYRDKTGTLWVGSQQGLHRMSRNPAGAEKTAPVSFTTYRHDPANSRSLSHNEVRELYEDHTGMLWISTENGLNRFDRKSGTFRHYPYTLSPSPAINATINRKFRHFAEDQQGNLWIGTNTQGLFQLNPERTRFTQVQHDPENPLSLRGSFVNALLVDRSGLLWVSIWGEGVDRAHPRQQPFQHYRPLPAPVPSLSNKYVDAILEDRSGIVWLATGAGLDRLDQRTGRFKTYRFSPNQPRGQPTRHVNALLEDRDGNLWVGSQGDLALFNRQTETFIPFTQDTLRYPGLGGNGAIFTLYEDRQGLLWLGTNNGIKSFDRKTGHVTHYAYDPKNAKGISDAWAISIHEDKQGNLWIGTGSVALNRLDRKTGRFTHYRPDRRKPGSLPADAVPSIFQDSKGNLWLGTSGGGLCRFEYETQTFQVFTQADGLADHSIFSIQEDNQGQLWLGTSKGLSRFSFADKTFINYDVSDGLPGDGFKKAHFKGKSGMLYFGGENGFVSFDPRQLTTNRHIPPVVITQAKLFDKPIPGKIEARTLHLNYDENFFSFEFAALNYVNPSKNQYAYQLAGLEKNWVYSGSRRYVSYTNLDPGTYVFRVKGSNNDGVWNEKGTSIQVIIHPPWWQTTWFRLVAILSLLLLAGTAVRLYTQMKLSRQRHEMKQVLQAQEGERQRLAGDLHDDLGSTLAAIKVQLEIVHEPDDALLQPIRLMEKAIRDLRHISHNLMPPEFARLGLTEALHETVNRVEANSGIYFLFISFGPERRLDNEMELTIYRIAVELIQNAIRHARAKQITVQLLFYPQQVSLLVEDDGRGYSATGHNKSAGIGLRNIRSRVTYLKSKLLVDSGERGTTIILEVPIDS